MKRALKFSLLFILAILSSSALAEYKMPKIVNDAVQIEKEVEKGCGTANSHPETASCSARVETPKNFCPVKLGNKESVPMSREAASNELSHCSEELKNCICEVLGTVGCASLVSGNETTKIDKEKLQGKTHLVFGPHGVELSLSQDDANLIAESQNYANHKDSNKLNLTKNSRLAKLTLSMLYIELWRQNQRHQVIKAGSSKGKNNVENKSLIPNNVPTADAAALSLFDTFKYADLNNARYEIGYALRSCKTANLNLAHMAKLMVFKKDPTYIEDKDLVCLMSYSSVNLSNQVILEKWPGCECDSHLEKEKGFSSGIGFGGVCVVNQNMAEEDHFDKRPIDARVPEALQDVITKLNKRYAPLKVVEIGLGGCSFPRYETGWNMKEGIKTARHVSLNDLSDHATGRACDLRSVTFIDGKCDLKTFSMLEKTKKSRKTPFCSALKTFSTRFGTTFEFKDAKGRASNLVLPAEIKPYKRGGFARFWKNLNQLVKDNPHPPLCPQGSPYCKAGQPIMSEDDWFQISIGAGLRNSFIDSGLIAYDPTLNPEHCDHFHFTAPENSITNSKWINMSNNEKDFDVKETFVEQDLANAADITHIEEYEPQGVVNTNPGPGAQDLIGK